MRSAARRLIRENAQLRREWKRAPRTPLVRQTAVLVIFRLLCAFVLAAAVFASSEAGLVWSTQSAIGAIWFLASAILLRFRILNTFYRIDYLAAFTVLPTPTDVVVRWNWSRVTRSAWRTGLDAVAILSAMAVTNAAGVGGWLAVLPLAALLTALVHALAVWLTFVPLPAVLNLLPLAGIVAFVGLVEASAWREWLVRFLAEQSETISIALPAGWVLRPYLAWLTSSRLESLALLIPALGLGASLVWARRQLANHYSPFAWALWHVFQMPPEEWKARFDEFLAAQPAPPGRTEILDSVEKREFLQPSFKADAGGWIERRVLACLTPREWTVIELAFFAIPRWTRLALIGSGLLAVSILSAAIAKRTTDPSIQAIGTWTSIVCGAVGGLVLLPLNTGFKRMAQPINAGGILIPFGALFPVTMKELMRVAAKASLVRGAFALPVMVVGGSLLGLALNTSPGWAAFAAAKITLLAVASTPMILALNQSSTTNDTSIVTFRALPVVGAFLAGFIGFVGLGVGSIFSPLPWSIIWIMLAAGISAGMASLYGELHARRSFDLMTRPKET
ncbi:MAG: hypothetical protein HY735_34740 [Verrucomicrobia bacterium]|nr:hypothetical protein [Verrucomicrobiota bacterium]